MQAQNLVPNSSFEEYFSCPENFNTHHREFLLPGWRPANIGTPDHFHSCSWGACDVPFNWAGQSNPHSGSGYVGIYVWDNREEGRNYREYVQTSLLEKLQAGRKYRISFYYRLASYAAWSIDRIGAHLSDTAFALPDDEVIRTSLELSVVRSDAKPPDGWQLATVDYTARGGEQVLTIGNFFDNITTRSRKVNLKKGKSPMLEHSSYYYIDDVSVESLEPAPADSVVRWSDGKEVKPDEVYILQNIHFAFDSYKLMPNSFPELDKLVYLLQRRPQWLVELSGHTDDQGSDAYNLNLSGRRAAAVGEYLIRRGIGRERIQSAGMGKRKPLVPGTDEQSRQLNRRVEARFILQQP